MCSNMTSENKNNACIISVVLFSSTACHDLDSVLHVVNLQEVTEESDHDIGPFKHVDDLSEFNVVSQFTMICLMANGAALELEHSCNIISEADAAACGKQRAMVLFSCVPTDHSIAAACCSKKS